MENGRVNLAPDTTRVRSSILRRGTKRLRSAVSVVVLLATCSILVDGVTATAGSPRARNAAGDSTVGPLFPHGVASPHSCTASVLAGSPDLLLTAAHCVTGTGIGLVFVPGYDGTAKVTAPYGVWTVDAAWVSQAWIGTRDPGHDYAILRVRPQVRNSSEVDIQSVTGGNPIAYYTPAGTTVSVPAYPAGLGDAPIACTAPTFDEGGFPGFGCAGYVGGTSGAPWLAPTGQPGVRKIVGLVGGLYQGGCRDDVSYSPPLQIDLLPVLLRAWLGLPGDNVPAPGSSGC